MCKQVAHENKIEVACSVPEIEHVYGWWYITCICPLLWSTTCLQLQSKKQYHHFSQLISGTSPAEYLVLHREHLLTVLTVKHTTEAFSHCQYAVESPNKVWHTDGHHRWRYAVNGEVSGFSHVIPYIQCVTNYNYICFHQYLIHFRVELDLDYLIEFVLLMAVKTLMCTCWIPIMSPTQLCCSFSSERRLK